MDKLIAGFAQQLQDALLIGSKAKFKIADNNITNIVISGLGGSGIGGTIAQNYLSNIAKIPVLVNKTYALPAFVNNNTLMIACSYSGNTEETVDALNTAIKKKSQIACITSGGKIEQIANKKNLDCIIIPSGKPPRACFGYSLVQILYILQQYKIINKSFEKDINASIELLNKEEKNIKQKAQKIAKQLADKTPIIYADNNMEGVAIRWRQQFNENGKMLAWHHVVPEMNHNELVGWRDKDNSKAVIFLKTILDHPRSLFRMQLNKATIKKYTSNLLEIESKGDSFLECVIYLTHLGDWISWYLAQYRGFDAVEVNVINKLKSDLKE